VQGNEWKLNVGKSSECKASVDSGEKRCNGVIMLGSNEYGNQEISDREGGSVAAVSE
jgi:hypothetical protein